MKNHRFRILLFFTVLIFAGSCMNSRKLITDEIVFKDGNSQTGTILSSDSSALKLRKMDESVITINWNMIDTIQGKKLKTFWLGVNTGYYKLPYFSVFRNETMAPRSFGMQYKIGMAYRGNKLVYTHLSFYPAKPYAISKFGFGYQYYLGQTTYLKKHTFFVGGEFNFMNAKYNNSAQITLEPYTGYEFRLSSQLRIHFKYGIQFNLANKNDQLGFNTTIGIHFMRRNFKRYYNSLNSTHQLPRK